MDAGERERERRERERERERERRFLTWFAHVHWLYFSLQHAQQWLFVGSKVMKLVLCRCKTVNKKRTMNNTIDNYFSQYTSSRQGGERMCQRHVHLYSSVSPHILRTRNRQETIACTHNYRGVPISGQGGLVESVSPHTLWSRNQKNLTETTIYTTCAGLWSVGRQGNHTQRSSGCTIC